MKFVLAFVLAFSLLRAAEDPANVLAQCRERILKRAERLPNYTCNEIVDRSYYRRAKPGPAELPCGQIRTEKLVLNATDRVRLEVKISDGKEIGSWPGASQFDSRSIFDLIGGGTFGTGPLGTLLVDVFGNKGATIAFQGEEDKLFGYSFKVPIDSSHYYIQAWGNWRPVAFEGIAWIDPSTFDLKRIRVQTGELPPETQSCYSTTEIEYDRVRTGTSEFLAPKLSTLTFLMRDATRNETSTAYSQCREYQVESTVRFDDGPASNAEPTPAQAALSLPAGLEIPVTFTSPIDSQTAAAGDVITAQTRKPVLDPQSGRILIPAGAAVEARITSIRFGRESPSYVLLSISIERFQISGAWSPIFASLSYKDQIENSHRMVSLAGASISLPSGTEPFTAAVPKNFLIFPASKNGHVVPRGFPTTWVTTAQPAR
jgi:hypothetical protein